MDEGLRGAGEVGCRWVRLLNVSRARVASDGLLESGVRGEEMDLEIWRTCSPEMARGSVIGAMRGVQEVECSGALCLFVLPPVAVEVGAWSLELRTATSHQIRCGCGESG